MSKDDATTKATEWSDWDAEGCGIECKAGVGMAIIDFNTPRHVVRWLCWDEVIALHQWIGAKIVDHQGL